MALTQFHFESQYLQCNHTVSVILPDKPRDALPRDFYGSGKKYKVLWLLHGTFGDHSDWVRKSMIELYACEKDLVVVMPSGMNANYANWPDFSIGYDMYAYLTEELMPLVYNWLPVSPKREDNYIAGLSMGGWGACIYAFNHPDKFAAAAILSAVPWNVETLEREEPDMWPRVKGMIENAGGMEDYLKSSENTWRLAGEKAGTGELPRLYFTIGKEDFLYPSYQRFKSYAQEIGLEASFEELEGFQHEWRFWNLSIQKALEFFGLDEADSGNPF